MNCHGERLRICKVTFGYEYVGQKSGLRMLVNDRGGDVVSLRLLPYIVFQVLENGECNVIIRIAFIYFLDGKPVLRIAPRSDLLACRAVVLCWGNPELC